MKVNKVRRFSVRPFRKIAYSLSACCLLFSAHSFAVSVTASANDGNVPQNTLDGNLSTRWSAEGDGQWIKYDLGSTQTVDDLEIAFFKGDQRSANFDVQVSTDNAIFSNIWSGNQPSSTKSLQRINLPDVAARWVRIVGHGNSDNLWNSYTEVKINTIGGGTGGGSNNGPYTGDGGASRVSVPGTIQAENYGRYSDTTPGNQGGQYKNQDVDITDSLDSGGGYIVGWMAGGEWLEYPITVSSSGNYKAEIRVASNENGGNFSVKIDGAQKGGNIAVARTGGWQTWVTKSVDLGSLSAGSHTLRMQVNSAAFNLNWIKLSKAGGSTGGGGGGSTGLDPNKAPSGNFDLGDWYLSVPSDTNGDGKADSIKEGQLNSNYENPQYFYTGNDGGMVFRCPISGSKTSSNTKYTRTELREMLRRGNTSISTKGVNKNNWVFGSAPSSARSKAGGVDGTLKATLKVDHVTTTGSSGQVGRVIIGQIHASSDEPLRLYYRKLPGNSKGSIYFAHEPRSGSEQWYELIGSRSNNASNPSNGIALNEKFSYVVNVTGNTLRVTIKRPGKSDVSKSVNMSSSGFSTSSEYMYFKAGVYNQNNSGSGSDYVQATFYELTNSHN